MSNKNKFSSKQVKYTPTQNRLNNKKNELDKKIEQRKAELDISIADTRRTLRRRMSVFFSVILIIAGIEFFIDKMFPLGIVILLIGLILMPFLWDKFREKVPCPSWIRPVAIILLFILAVFVRIQTTPVTTQNQKQPETTQTTDLGDEK